ncbi:MAG: DUF5683 domain-containing protein [Ferruginibacter sp.]
MKNWLIVIIFFSFLTEARAQQDTLKITRTGKFKPENNLGKVDTVPVYNPRIAIIRSAIIPGWGQYTNKKYWKIPIVYGALITTGVIFIKNVKTYKDAKQAYLYATDTIPGNDNLIKEPYYSVRSQPERIRSYRNSVRQNVDYSVLFFILFWGINVADAAVDAHLKTFDVSDDISMRLKAGYSPMARTNGLSLIINIGDKNLK